MRRRACRNRGKQAAWLHNEAAARPTRNTAARSLYGEPLAALLSPRKLGDFFGVRRPLSVVAPPRGAPPSPSPAMAARDALRCGLAYGLAARRPSRRLRRAPPLAGSPLRLRQGARPLRGAFGALAYGSVARWRREPPCGSVFPPLLPSGGLSPRPFWAGLGWAAFRAPPREFRAFGRGEGACAMFSDERLPASKARAEALRAAREVAASAELPIRESRQYTKKGLDKAEDVCYNRKGREWRLFA